MKLKLPNESRGAQMSNAMTDISFLLIIFFLVSAVFVANRGLLLALPGRNTKPIELPPSRVVQIDIANDGTTTVNGVTAAGNLSQILRSLYGPDPKLVTIVKTSPKVTYQQVLDLLQTARTAGASTFSIVAANGPVPVSIARGQR